MHFFRIFCLLALAFSAPALALNVEDALPEPTKEARAQNLFHEIRCVVCQGETIADSPAQVAGDLRRLVREKVAAGESDAGIKAYLGKQYGPAILMHPPLNSSTAALWFGPWVLVFVACALVFSYFRRAKKASDL